MNLKINLIFRSVTATYLALAPDDKEICATGFCGLCSSLISLQIFVRLLRLISQNVANVFNLTSGLRVSVVTCRAKDVSRGSPAGLKI